MVAPKPHAHTPHYTTIPRMVAAVLAAALIAAPAAAEEVRIAAPIEAGSLHDGPLDMVLYYLPVAEGLLEVTGTYAPKAGGEARRFVLGLSEGDAVSFATPGYPQATYRFSRAGMTVTAAVSVSPRREPAMIELLFVACLRADLLRCEERSRLFLVENGLMGCMVTTQAELADWSRAHPELRIARWSCRRADTAGLQA
jgi:hypothetical protein